MSSSTLASTTPATSWVSHLDEQKRGLAKLLARENITVRHDNVPTASFNIKTRELLLPKWTNLTVDQYDLIIGHEVAHALYTDDPALLATCREYFTFVNVIEDARIERRIKDVFPGLRGAFTRGYADFFHNGPIFNDVHQKPITSYSFIDRINIHYKIGAHVTVPFSAEERPYLTRIDALRTFADAVKLAKELYDRAKREQTEPSPESGDASGASSGDSESSSSEASSEAPNAQGEDTSSSNAQGEDKSSPSNAQDTNANGSDADANASATPTNDTTDQGQAQGASSPSSSSPNPQAETDLANSEAMKSLVAKSTGLEPTHLTYTALSEAFVDAFVVNADTFTTVGMAHLHKIPQDLHHAEQYLADFASKYGSAVAHMAREFERRKTAKLHEHARTARTGRIDVTKLASYKFRDDLFKAVTILPNGKSHGIVLLIDGSSSMGNIYRNTLDQVLLFAQFAKKVNIPLQAYVFRTNAIEHHAGSTYGRRELAVRTFAATHDHTLVPSSSCELVCVADTTSSQWKSQQTVLAAIASFWSNGARGRYYSYGDMASRVTTPPPFSDLSTTPIHSALLLGERLVARLKSSRRLDKMTLVMLTDGDDNIGLACTMQGRESSKETRRRGPAVILRDTVTRQTYADVVNTSVSVHENAPTMLTNTQNALPAAVVDMLRRRHACRVVAIRLLDRRTINGIKSSQSLSWTMDEFSTISPDAWTTTLDRAKERAMIDALCSKKEAGQVTVPAPYTYYDATILVNDGAMDLDADGFDDLVTRDMSAKKIAAAFTKSNVTAAKNKVFVNAVVPFLA